MKFSRTSCAVTTILAGVLLAVPTSAIADTGQAKKPTPAATSQVSAAWPNEFALPNGFQPEGIAISKVPYAYFGSVANGSIYRVDLRTGEGRTISQAPGAGHLSIGLKLDDKGRLFVAGGDGTDHARVIDVHTGKVLRSYTFSDDPQVFVNDVTITENAAWFTDSLRGVLYSLPFGPGGALPTKAQTLTLSGDGFDNSGVINGIAPTPDGKGLIVDETDGTKKLWHVDPRTGTTHRVKFSGLVPTDITTADGLLLQGCNMFVADRVGDRFFRFTLNAAGTEATYVQTITDPRFDGSSGVAAYGDRLYMPNSKSPRDTAPTVPFDAVSVPNPAAR